MPINTDFLTRCINTLESAFEQLLFPLRSDASVDYAIGMTRDHRIIAIVIAAIVWCMVPAAGNVSTALGQEEARTEQLEELRQRR